MGKDERTLSSIFGEVCELLPSVSQHDVGLRIKQQTKKKYKSHFRRIRRQHVLFFSSLCACVPYARRYLPVCLCWSSRLGYFNLFEIICALPSLENSVQDGIICYTLVADSGLVLKDLLLLSRRRREKNRKRKKETRGQTQRDQGAAGGGGRAMHD